MQWEELKARLLEAALPGAAANLLTILSQNPRQARVPGEKARSSLPWVITGSSW